MEKTKGNCVPLHVLKVFRPVLAFLVSIAIVFLPVVGNVSIASAAARPAAPDHRDGDERDGDKNKDNDGGHDLDFRGDSDRDRGHDFDFRGDFDGDHDHDRDNKGGCDLRSARGEIKHVIYIQFDNVHFERDSPNVFSDLELMPHLLNFMQNNGTLLTDSHTPLISHTADDIITSLTGVYGDRHGGSVANSFRVYAPAPVPATNVGTSVATFTYWTDPVSAAIPDNLPIMLAANGKNAPAPWVPFTRAGCNFGAVSIANMELENVTSDITKVFGNPSPESAEGTGANAVADFEGIAIHCAQNTACASAPNAKPDLLPDEPNGYSGFQGLFGHKYAAPFIVPAPGDPLRDASGNLLDFDGNPITDAFLNKGFPGFTAIDAAQTLAYVADMQEHGVPVTFAYIADIHDNPAQPSGAAPHQNPYVPAACQTDPETQALGPGDVCKHALAAAYDEAFDKFFTRLKNHGIDQTNTLFVITTEEQDHFAGGTPKAPCDGQTTFCTYDVTVDSPHAIGEIDLGITPLVNVLDPGFLSGISYNIHSDMAPTFYLGGQPARTDVNARRFERDAFNLTATNPITTNVDHLTTALADPVEMGLLHMVTADPQRTPTFTLFGDPDYFFLTGGGVARSPGFAWNHGGIQPEITTTWCGLVGPGISAKGVDNATFADETDYRPTILALTGLKDDYQHEGRVLVEDFKPWAVPDGVRDSADEFVELARAFKRIDAPLGELGKVSLQVSTKALASNDPGDSTYNTLEGDLITVTAARDSLAQQMLLLLEGAAFHGQHISEHQERALTHQAESLLSYVNSLPH